MKARLIFALIIVIALSASIFASAQDNEDYWYSRALGLAGDGHYKEAIDAFDSALQINPDNADAWAGKASALKSLAVIEKSTDKVNESLQCYDKAIGLYDDAIKKDPQDANSLYYKGIILRDRAIAMKYETDLGVNVDEKSIAKYIDESFKAFDKATETSPKFVAAWRNKGNTLFIMGRYNDSLQAYDKAIETDPKYMLAWYNKGLSLYELGRYQEAIQAYNTSIKIGPPYADIWFNYGKALAGLENYDSAVKAYDKAIDLNPSLAAAWYYKALAFEKLGLGTGAQAAMGKATSMGYKNSSKTFYVDFDK